MRERKQRVADADPPFSSLSPCPFSSVVLATIRDFNYFLIRSFQPSLARASPGIMPRSSLRMLNATNLPSFRRRQHVPSSSRSPPPSSGPSLFSSEDRSPREELRVRDCEAYSTQTRGSCLDPLASGSAGSYA